MNQNLRDLTFGEKAVGLTFNPSNNNNVQKIKELYAEIIDILHEIERPASDNISSNDINRLVDIAITQAQTAQMWAVKVITLK
jgi:hypothetical protein